MYSAERAALSSDSRLAQYRYGSGIVPALRGVTQFWLPDYATGYCVDDNSRALITAVRMHRMLDDPSAHELVVRYLAFLFSAQRPGHSALVIEMRPLWRAAA